MNKHYMNENTIHKLKLVDQACGQNMFDELVQIFIDETPHRLQLIERFINEKNYSEIVNVAQIIKNSSNYLGADMLAKLISYVEECALKKQLPRNIDSVLKDLNHFYFVASEYFRANLAA